MMKRPLSLTVNGEGRETLVDTRQTLLGLLRDDLALTGTKEGCSNGNCGACTVIMNGRSVCSCLVFALEARNAQVQTVEGLARDGDLHPLQKSFMDLGGLQCGICTPGFLMSAKYLLERIPDPSEEQVRLAIAGNLCRCTGYDKIVRAILVAAREMRK
jgi:carbon-monoxide dehydrogenase small subunit